MTAPAEPAPPPPLVEPGTRDWDETATQAARAGDAYWLDRDWPTEPDDPSDHYNY